MQARGHPLRAYREGRGLSYAALGKELGVAGLTVRRWEEAEVLPQGEKRDRIEKLTGITFGRFVDFYEAMRREAAE